MKLCSFIILFCFNLSINSQSVLEYNIHYKGKDIYILNPFTGSGIGFCVDSVSVNGKMTSDDINSSAFNIDLTNLDFELDDSKNIKIYHGENCLPKILIDYSRPQSTFELKEISLDENGILKWSTHKEVGCLPYIIEQYRWNKWIKVGSVDAKGMHLHNEYVDTVLFHQGLNKFRVKQNGYHLKLRMSTVVEIETETFECYFTRKPNGPENRIEFEVKNDRGIYIAFETLYDLFDTYGNLVKKGRRKFIDCSSLKKGLYYLNFDNKSKEVIYIE